MNKNRSDLLIGLISLVISLFLLAGCAQSTSILETEQAVLPTDLTQPSAGTFEPGPTAIEAAELELTEPPVIESSVDTAIREPTTLPALDPEPQTIDFETSDGEKLVGTYFPAAVNPAPVVVLMHWAPGDGCDWRTIATWLQNRAVVYDCPTSMDGPWLDASWFPELSTETSYGVFTFTFRNCSGGCNEFLRDKWVLDAQAALKTASELPGADPVRIISIGASIGADGAVVTCDGDCIGAMSFSPGNYLKLPYAESVSQLGELDPPIPVVCLAAEGDGNSPETCQAGQGDHYQVIIYPGDAHGMRLIDPALEPNALEALLQFLAVALGSELEIDE